MSTEAPPREAARELHHPVIVIDADERLVSISASLRRALGIGPDVQPPGTIRAIMDEDSARRIHEVLQYGGTVRNLLAVRLVGQDGGSWTASAEYLPTTGGGAVLVISPDSDRWTDEDASLLLERSQDLIFSVQLRPSFSFRYVNAASSPVTGYRPDELRADPSLFTGSVHPDDQALLDAALANARRLEAPVVFRFRHRSGEWRWFEFAGTPVADEDDQVSAVEGIVRDVTVRHRLQEQFRLLAERSPEMIYRVRFVPATATDYVSPACVAVTGRQPEEFYNDPLLLLRYVHDEDQALLQRCFDDPDTSCTHPIRFRLFHADGSLHWIELVNVPVRDEAGRLVAIEGVCRDVTERQEVERMLQAMNRRMNLLASLTRHDVLNQLTVLLGALELAGTAESTTELAWFLDRSRAAAWAIHRLLEFTRDYQKIGQGAPCWVSMTELGRRAAASFAGEGPTIEVADGPWEILADPLIEQVFYNLIENAIRHGESVSRVKISVETPAAGGLVVVCEDDGIGVPVNEKERIFERGYGRNTGLGLYLACEILASTEITIAETGRPGVGARFEIRVPREACRTAAPGAETSSTSGRTGPCP